MPRTRHAVCSAATCSGLREENSKPQRCPVLFRAIAFSRKVFADCGRRKRTSTGCPKSKSAGVKTAIPLKLSSRACPQALPFASAKEPYRYVYRKNPVSRSILLASPCEEDARTALVNRALLAL